MQNGNIIEQGTHETLLKAKGAYADLTLLRLAFRKRRDLGWPVHVPQ